MKRAAGLLVVVLLGIFAGPAWAGSTLRVRLVEANNSGGGTSRQLSDVAELLQNNLPFNTFRLVSSKTMPLPAGGDMDLGRGFAAHCEGPQRSLTIRVTRDRKAVLNTTAELRDGTPLILGGFPIDGGKIILVLLAE